MPKTNSDKQSIQLIWITQKVLTNLNNNVVK